MFPDELAFVQGFMWVKTDDGHLIQVDPATNNVVGDITVDTTRDYPAHFCQGLGTDGMNIWACSARGDADNKIAVPTPPRSPALQRTHTVPVSYRECGASVGDGVLYRTLSWTIRLCR